MLYGCASESSYELPNSAKSFTSSTVASLPKRTALADAINRALNSSNRADFYRLFSPDSSSYRKEMLWSNLMQIQAEFSADESGLRVKWWVPGESGKTWQLLDLKTSCASDCTISEILPRKGQPAPLWVVEPIEVVTGEGWVSVQGVGARQWGRTLAAARTDVLTAQLSPIDDGFSGEVAIVVPSTTGGFEAVVGASAREFASTGALTWTEDSGRNGDSGTEASAVRIIINPDATKTLTEDEAQLLVTHEIVHVATTQLGVPSAGSLWVSEGVGESVALKVHSVQAERSRGLLRENCSVLAAVPPDTAFIGGESRDAKVSELAYARAWAYVETLKTHLEPAIAKSALVQLWQGKTASAFTTEQLSQWAIRWCGER